MEIKRKRTLKKRICSGIMAIVTALTMSGCNNNPKIRCSIKDPHIHKYTKGELTEYIQDEHQTKFGFTRQDDYCLVNDDDLELRQYERSEGLYRINENIDYIQSILDKGNKYLEYQYYDNESDIPQWTTNPNKKGKTDQVRITYISYEAYKIEKDLWGRRYLIKSKRYDHFSDIPTDYTYIKEIFTQKHTDSPMTYQELESYLVKTKKLVK